MVTIHERPLDDLRDEAVRLHGHLPDLRRARTPACRTPLENCLLRRERTRVDSAWTARHRVRVAGAGDTHDTAPGPAAAGARSPVRPSAPAAGAAGMDAPARRA